MSEQRNEKGEAPLALAPGNRVSEGDTLVLVLRDIAWSEGAVDDLITSMRSVGLDGRYVILYLGGTDEAHVVRKLA